MPTPTQADKIYTFTQSVANWTSGAGDPNLTNLDSKRGYVYQDWTNGQLYIYGESQGADQWLRVLRDEASGGSGGDGTIFTNYQGYNIWARSVDAGSGVIFDWDIDRGLKVYSGDGTSNQSADFDLRVLYDHDGVAVADWNTYVLASVTEGLVTLNWDQRNLLSEGIPTVDWANQLLRETGYSQVCLNWNLFELYDQEFAAVSANWNLRQLYDSSAGGLSVDWQARQLRADASTITADWFSRILYGAWTTQETSKTSGNVMSMANYAPTTTSGTYNPAAPANAGMSIYHVASTNALIAAMTLALHGTSSAIDSVPIGGVMSFTSRYGVTALTVTYGGYTFLGTAVATIAAGATIQWRKVGATTVARIS